MPLFKRKEKDKAPAEKTIGEAPGLVLFSTVQDAMKAEKVLKEAGYEVRMVAPPPELRKGCDLAVEIVLVEQVGIERALKAGEVTYISIAPLTGSPTELLDVVEVTDFGQWEMIKTGNMKIAYDKKTGIIVNTSGGGCPDIPYLHFLLLDKTLTEAPQPRDVGFTLCARMLDRAFQEARTRWQGGK
jgi:hypothetical protein